MIACVASNSFQVDPISEEGVNEVDDLCGQVSRVTSFL
jgi:hypothetical protein